MCVVVVAALTLGNGSSSQRPLYHPDSWVVVLRGHYALYAVTISTIFQIYVAILTIMASSIGLPIRIGRFKVSMCGAGFPKKDARLLKY